MHVVNEWVQVTPLDKAEFVIRSRYVEELNGPTKEGPAKVFTRTVDNKQAESAVSPAEYERLKCVLLGSEDPLAKKKS